MAETSLTVPGIRYVVDAGFARVKRYRPDKSAAEADTIDDLKQKYDHVVIDSPPKVYSLFQFGVASCSLLCSMVLLSM